MFVHIGAAQIMMWGNSMQLAETVVEGKYFTFDNLLNKS